MGLFFGTVIRYDSTECKYEIQYDDGDFVKMTELEVLSSLMEEEENISTSGEKNAVLPLSDRTNRMDINNNNITKKHDSLKSDDDTDTLFKGQRMMTTLVPPPRLSSLPAVPPPSLPPSRRQSDKDEAQEKEENDRMMQNMTRSNLAELRPDGRWERNVPMAEVVDDENDGDDGDSEDNNHRSRRNRRRQRGDQMMAGEACVCKIAGCVVM